MDKLSKVCYCYTYTGEIEEYIRGNTEGIKIADIPMK